MNIGYYEQINEFAKERIVSMGDFDLKAAATNAMNSAKVQKELAAKLQEDLNGDGKITGKEKFNIKTSLFLANEDGSVKIDIDGDGIFDKTVKGLVKKDGTTNVNGDNLKVDDEKYGSVKVQAYLSKADRALENQKKAEADLATSKANVEELKNNRKSIEDEKALFDKNEATRLATLKRQAEIADKQREANSFKQTLDAISEGRHSSQLLIKQYEGEKAKIKEKIALANKNFIDAGDKVAELEKKLQAIKDHTSCEYVDTEKALNKAKSNCKKAHEEYLKTKEDCEKQIEEKDKLIQTSKKSLERDKKQAEEWVAKIGKKVVDLESKLDANIKADVAVSEAEYLANLDNKIKKIDEKIDKENKNIKNAETNIKNYGEEHAKWAEKFKDALAQNQKDKEVCETDQYKKEGFIASDGVKVTKSQTENEAVNNDPVLKARKEATIKAARTEMENSIKEFKKAVENYHAQEASTAVGGEKSAAKSLAKAKEKLGEVAAKYAKTAEELVNEYDNKTGYFTYLKQE